MVSSIGSSLLAATMFLGQATDVRVIQQPGGIYSTTQTQQPPTSQRPFFSWFQDRPVLTKLQSWFGVKKDQQEPPSQMQPYNPQRGTVFESKQPTPTQGFFPSNPATQPQDFPKKMPSPSSQAPPPQNMPRSTAMPATPYSVQNPTNVQTVNNTRPLTQTGVQVPYGNPKAPAASQPASPLLNVKYPILPQLANKIGRDEKFAWITGQLEIENNTHVLYYATPETVDIYHGRIVLNPHQVSMSQFHRGDLISVRGDVVQRTQGAGPVYRLTDANLIERVK